MPSAIQQWNDLPVHICEFESLASFKKKLKDLFKPPTVSSFYIKDDKFRNNCSNLNFDLCNNQLTPSPFCECRTDKVNDTLLKDAFFYKYQCFSSIKRQEIALVF